MHTTRVSAQSRSRRGLLAPALLCVCKCPVVGKASFESVRGGMYGIVRAIRYALDYMIAHE